VYLEAGARVAGFASRSLVRDMSSPQEEDG
jgi:hypothetical protein